MKVKSLIVLSLILTVGILIGHLMQVLANPGIVTNPGHSVNQIGAGTFAEQGDYVFPGSSRVGIGMNPGTNLDVAGDIQQSGSFFQGTSSQRISITRGGYVDFQAPGYDVIEFAPNPSYLSGNSWEHFKIIRQGSNVGLYMTGDLVAGSAHIGGDLNVGGDITGLNLAHCSSTSGTLNVLGNADAEYWWDVYSGTSDKLAMVDSTVSLCYSGCSHNAPDEDQSASIATYYYYYQGPSGSGFWYKGTGMETFRQHWAYHRPEEQTFMFPLVTTTNEIRLHIYNSDGSAQSYNYVIEVCIIE